MHVITEMATCTRVPDPCAQARTEPWKPEAASSTPGLNSERPDRKRAAQPSPGHRERQRIKVLPDDLGKMIQEHSEMFANMEWESFVEAARGRGDLAPSEEVQQGHPAGPLLRHLAYHGAPVVSTTEPWSDEDIEKKIRRGSHQSCKDHLDFLREEMLEFVQKGFWVLLPYTEVMKRRRQGKGFRKLKVSPLGIIPQRERRPRLIVDYTYYGVNPDSLKLGPAESMQFGRALERTLYNVHHANPRYGPVHMAKIDLADGFYRVKLAASGIEQLGVIFPRYPGEQQMIAFPLVLPMGWVESVPYFCAVTETVADLANSTPTTLRLPQHPLEHLASTPPAELHDSDQPEPTVPPSATGRLAPADDSAHLTPLGPKVLRPFQKPVRFTDIYIDDYILGVQGAKPARAQHLRRILHAIDQVFRPLDNEDSPHRKHVPSVKKFRNGDAYLTTRKVILGWILDTLRGTLELPAHRQERLAEIFSFLRGRDRVGLSKWRKILGELRSMAIGIPGSRGLFSLLQEGLKYTDKGRIRISPEMLDQLLDFEYLSLTLRERPTSLAELVPDHPVAVGPHDASRAGMGGVWFPAVTNANFQPMLWRAQFPPEVTEALVSFENPEGTINNSELELAGGIAAQDVLLQHVDCSGRTIVPLADNTPTVAWHHKGSTSTTGPTAYLLRVNSLHQRHYRYLAKSDYISGPANQMADDCSRLWRLTDSQLLAHFDLHYPQKHPWRIAVLRSNMHSALISALLKQRPDPQSFLGALAPKTATGAFGKPSLPISPTQIATSPDTVKPASFIFSKYSPRASAMESSHPAATLSGVDKWRTTYGPSARKSPTWM